MEKDEARYCKMRQGITRLGKKLQDEARISKMRPTIAR